MNYCSFYYKLECPRNIMSYGPRFPFAYRYLSKKDMGLINFSVRLSPTIDTNSNDVDLDIFSR